MSLEEIIKGCINENKKCQRELFGLLGGKMLFVCKRYARYPEEAKDILQEGFIKVFDNITKFRGEGSFEGWVRRIMINTALKYYRKSCFQKEISGLESYQEGSEEPDIYKQLGERELLELINQLPDGYKIVFNLYVIEGYSHKEIAETLAISAGTSRSQLVKARRMLQKQIQELYKIVI